MVESHHNKDQILKKLVQKHGLNYQDSVAIGDSRGDISLLAAAERAIAFNPYVNLLEAAKDNAWKIVVERKSIAYEREEQDGRYLLA